MTRIVQRSAPLRVVQQLEAAGMHPLLARIYAARGIERQADLDYGLSALLPPQEMRGIAEAAQLLADAIEADARLLIVADYDCDGATACAVGMRALRAMGAQVEYLVPNRFEYGYGLTPEIVALAAQREPDVIITVDNGIASIDGVAAAQAAGIATVITDHHLPGETLPQADVIVNPNQPGCEFPSKSIAGVGVMFYTMLALRAELRTRDAFAAKPEPNLAALLDLVALGTVADVVKLDRNNRILVSQGLARMRAGKMQPGVAALFAAAGREPANAGAFDLGFALGPRLNAAGRLTDMALGIECLITDDMSRALNIARELDALNRERRTIESSMKEAALLALEDFDTDSRCSLALFNPDWHQGVIGILASRIRERMHRPAIAFARASSDGSGDGELKGSGRSIAGLHLRDVLDLVTKREPDLILKFGGHAMAAGLTLREADFARFCAAFEQAVVDSIEPAALQASIETDGPLESAYATLQCARMLEREIWGQGFPLPGFCDEFAVENQRLLKDAHLKLTLRKDGNRYDAICFNRAEFAPERLRAAYRLSVNEYNGVASVQLMLDHIEPA